MIHKKLSKRVCLYIFDELQARFGRPPTADEYEGFINGDQHIRSEILRNGVKRWTS